MGLRLASDTTKTIDLGDEAWVKVRTDVSKRSMNRLLAHMPQRPQDDIKESGLTIEEGLEFQIGLFESLVVEWSLDVPPTAEAYLSIAREDAEGLDAALAEHFEALMPTKAEQGKP